MSSRRPVALVLWAQRQLHKSVRVVIDSFNKYMHVVKYIVPMQFDFKKFLKQPNDVCIWWLAETIQRAFRP